ncbi:hypothetical protein RCL1_001057 [Eukaryota sp. TZLM3-RCL]
MVDSKQTYRSGAFLSPYSSHSHNRTPTSTPTKPSPPSQSTPQQPQTPPSTHPVSLKSFLHQTASSGPVFRCTVIREKSLLSLYPQYYLYSESDQRLLCVARKRKKTATASFVFSTSKDELSRSSPHCVGTLDSQSRIGSNVKYYSLHDDGKDIVVSENGELKAIKNEILVFSLDDSKKKDTGVRGISVLLPINSSQSNNQSNLMDALISGSPGNFTRLTHNQPVFDNDSQILVLNFGNRVTEESCKNFQLVDDCNNIALQFGRTGKNSFVLDFRSPLSPLQAFSIAISMFH